MLGYQIKAKVEFEYLNIFAIFPMFPTLFTSNHKNCKIITSSNTLSLFLLFLVFVLFISRWGGIGVIYNLVLACYEVPRLLVCDVRLDHQEIIEVVYFPFVLDFTTFWLWFYQLFCYFYFLLTFRFNVFLVVF